MSDPRNKLSHFFSRRYPIIILVSCILLLSTLGLDYFLHKTSVSRKIAQFNRALDHNKTEINTFVNVILGQFTTIPTPDNLQSIKKHQNPEFIIHVYENDSLVYWTDNRIWVKNPQQLFKQNGLYFISNGWYWVEHVSKGMYDVWGYMLIKNQYGLQNDYLQTNYLDSYGLSPNVQISKTKTPGAFEVADSKGETLCYLDFSQDHSQSGLLLSIVLFLLGVGFVFFILGLYAWNRSANTVRKRYVSLGVIAFLLLALKMLMSSTFAPHALYDLELFSPFYFASSTFLNSLGDLFLLAATVFFISYLLVRNLTIHRWKIPQKNWQREMILLLYLLVNVIFFSLIVQLIKSLVLNSEVSFEFYHIHISFLSFVALFSIALFLISSLMLLENFIQNALKLISLTKLVVYSFVSVVLVTFATSFINLWDSIWIALSFQCVFWVIAIIHKYFKSIRFITRLLCGVFMASVLCSMFFLRSIKTRHFNEMKLLATTLYSEHDPVAEDHLFQIDEHLRQDTNLVNLLITEKFSYNRLVDYLHNQYFSGYWNYYDLQVTLCNSEDSLVIKSSWQRQLCERFFEELLQLKGNRIDTLMFYNLEDHNGLISYLGRYHYVDSLHNISVFMELDSKNNTAVTGYPLLLLNRSQQKLVRHEFSFAKYYNNELMMQSGHYQYLFNTASYPPITHEYEMHSLNGYMHLFYKPEKDFMVVISSQELGLIDRLLMFSYITLFFLVLVCLFLIIRTLVLKKRFFVSSFRNKILIAISGVSLIALLTLGVLLLYLLVRQYNERYNNLLRERLNTIYYHLTENTVVGDWLNGNTVINAQEFENILQQASNYYYSDINIYSLKGRLISTSRPEIFQKRLVGNLINPLAFDKLSREKSSEFVVHEKIGKLDYLSAYTPLQNSVNETIAYLNVPYFSHQNELREEISRLTITVINISVLLIIISMIIAIILSNALTYPLRLIQSRFREIRLAELNKKIEYHSKDEIGDLIESYNFMVDELDKNIKLLAKSERETAWREMAKQVAHEIKNPLTPIKLSIQQLQRMVGESPEKKEEYIQKMSQTILQQIDNLSIIATEFSNLAKMPIARNEKFELTAVIEYVVNLFSDKDVRFFHPAESIFIYADKEQIQRVFINLLTNAFQAIPTPEKERVSIKMEQGGGNVSIEVIDNGSGIDQETVGKLFQPNFTTKSSGSGLGLTIVKNILESSGGSISYLPNPEGGSVFTVILPRV